MEKRTPLVYLEKYGGKIDKEMEQTMEEAGYEVWFENFGHWTWKLKKAN